MKICILHLFPSVNRDQASKTWILLHIASCSALYLHCSLSTHSLPRRVPDSLLVESLVLKLLWFLPNTRMRVYLALAKSQSRHQSVSWSALLMWQKLATEPSQSTPYTSYQEYSQLGIWFVGNVVLDTRLFMELFCIKVIQLQCGHCDWNCMDINWSMAGSGHGWQWLEEYCSLLRLALLPGQ